MKIQKNLHTKNHTENTKSYKKLQKNHTKHLHTKKSKYKIHGIQSLYRNN